MADETMWFVRYVDGKWEVEEAEGVTKDDIWIGVTTNGPYGLEVIGYIFADCENDAVMTACHMLRDIYTEVNSASLARCFVPTLIFSTLKGELKHDDLLDE